MPVFVISARQNAGQNVQDLLFLTRPHLPDHHGSIYSAIILLPRVARTYLHSQRQGHGLEATLAC